MSASVTPPDGSVPSREGLIVGVNLPWIAYGCDFGANAWQPEGGVGSTARRPQLEATLSRLASDGIRHVRWFLLCDGRAGIARTAEGGRERLGLDRFILRDLDAAVEVAGRLGVRILFTLLDFKWFERAAVVDGVRLGGRSRVIADEERRLQFLDEIVTPIFERLGRAPCIWGWDVINEPEWILRRWRRPCRLSRASLRALVTGVVVRARALCAGQAVTVGLASSAGLDLVRDLGLDFYQWHWYDGVEDRGPLARPVASFDLDRPAWLGEFPTSGASRAASEIVDAARGAGFLGALAWSALLDDKDSSARVATTIASDQPGVERA